MLLPWAPDTPVPEYDADERLQRAFAQGWQAGQENREDYRPTDEQAPDAGDDGEAPPDETAPAAQPPADFDEGTLSAAPGEGGPVYPEDAAVSPEDADAAA